MPEAMKKIRKDLGKDAVIKFKSHLHRWFFRVISQKKYSMIAAI